MTSGAEDALDRTYSPENDGLGEHERQTLIRGFLRPLLARFLAEHGVVAHVRLDQFMGSVTPFALERPGWPF
jgi:hypothetical protein